MSRYLVKDEVTGEVYPCADISDVEWAVDYVIGDCPTHAEEAEFDELLNDLLWIPEGETSNYPNLSVSVQVK